MSLTNPNTPVSQQDLKDLYEQKILPYIGGAFGLVATGIDSANLYSTTERVVGQWIDGKPLYQKSFETVSPNTTKATQKIVQLDAECRIQNFFGVIGESISGSVAKKPLNYGNPELSFYMHTYSPYGNDLWMYVTRSAEVNAPVWVTVQYTKTTDSAVESYGTDTTYSTDEHVVGSWIDGRPVYQKTIYRDTPITITTSDSEYATITGIGSLVDFRLIRANSTGVPWESLSGINASVIIASSSLRVRSVVSNYSDTVNKSYAILQYTKSS